MPKNWGIQFEQRIQQFFKTYTGHKLHESDAEADVRRIKRELKEAEKTLKEAAACTGYIEEAIGILMEIGPMGLMELEWETKLEGYTPGQFVNAYKNGVKY